MGRLVRMAFATRIISNTLWTDGLIDTSVIVIRESSKSQIHVCFPNLVLCQDLSCDSGASGTFFIFSPCAWDLIATIASGQKEWVSSARVEFHFCIYTSPVHQGFHLKKSFSTWFLLAVFVPVHTIWRLLVWWIRNRNWWRLNVVSWDLSRVMQPPLTWLNEPKQTAPWSHRYEYTPWPWRRSRFWFPNPFDMWFEKVIFHFTANNPTSATYR